MDFPIFPSHTDHTELNSDGPVIKMPFIFALQHSIFNDNIDLPWGTRLLNKQWLYTLSKNLKTPFTCLSLASGLHYPHSQSQTCQSEMSATESTWCHRMLWDRTTISLKCHKYNNSWLWIAPSRLHQSHGRTPISHCTSRDHHTHITWLCTWSMSMFKEFWYLVSCV